MDRSPDEARDHPATAATRPDARRSARLPADGPVRVRLETTELVGTCENLSEIGILLLSEASVRVVVEREGPAGLESRPGRLVRIQRMGADGSGLAIEFDPA